MAKPTDSKGRPLTYDHLRSRKKPRYGYVPLLMDQALGDEYDRLQKEKGSYVLRQARLKERDPELDEKLAALDAEIEAAEEAMLAETVTFKFRSIGGDAVDALIDDHPPTKKQMVKQEEEGGEKLTWNPETFPQALVAASLVDPELSLEEVEEMWKSEDWTSPELQLLFATSMEVNSAVRTVQAKKGSGRTPS